MNTTENSAQDLNWIGRLVGTFIVAWILATVLGSMDLFEKTFVIQGKLSASHLVRFLGYSTALAALWMIGQRWTMSLQKKGGRWSFMQHLILPVVTLIVISSVNSIALLLLKPLMNSTMHNLYNWVFIVGILACSAWVIMAVLGQSTALTEAFTSAAEKFGISAQAKKCSACNIYNDSSAKYCKQCGKELDSATK